MGPGMVNNAIQVGTRIPGAAWPSKFMPADRNSGSPLGLTSDPIYLSSNDQAQPSSYYQVNK